MKNKTGKRKHNQTQHRRLRRLKFSHIDATIDHDIDTIIDMVNNGEYPLPPAYAKPYRFSNGHCVKVFNANLEGEVKNLIRDIRERLIPSVTDMHLDDESPFAETKFFGAAKDEIEMLLNRINIGQSSDLPQLLVLQDTAIRIKLLELANGYDSWIKFQRNGVL